MDGNPNRAKSCIVALGNLERGIWSCKDKYAPVLSSTFSRLLVSMAVNNGRKLKQADCKMHSVVVFYPMMKFVLLNLPSVVRNHHLTPFGN